ncbi:MAG: branched-chain amino acid aminotransferase [Oscillospiraceae bacterium]|jgi:branched-chain amino acid aminotransferase|nr:branched-chain amino acid aminotransferase [Oscillospiraceae bacterium]
MEYSFTKSQQLKNKPDESRLGFGRIFTDYMFTMEYKKGEGWHNAEIRPYAPFMLDPSASVLHYSQSVFEGLKAYRTADGGVNLFRARDNFKRLNTSCVRLSIPEIDADDALFALRELLRVEERWVPSAPDTTLYIRPTIIATDPFLGVHAAEQYLFFIILSPSGAYYPEGMAPVRIYVEDAFVRAVRGGVGFAKTGGNYAASIRAGDIAQENGFAQVLWLDGVEQRYVEEVGSMNMFFMVDGELWTPALNGSILPGITRDSVIRLANGFQIPVIEKKIDVNELFELGAQGRVREAFGTGTAAVISPVGWLQYRDRALTIADGKTGPIAQKLYDSLTGIQFGRQPDPYHWVETL